MPPQPPTARKGPNRNLLIALAAAAVVAAVLIGGSLALTAGDDSSSSPTTTAPTTTGDGTAISFLEGIPQHNTVLGSTGANVRLLQYEDLQCPVCKRYTEEVFPTLVAEYVKPGQVKVDFRGIAFIGDDSEKALRIALAAGKQNKLWQVVELFYAEQGEENSGWVTDEKVDEILAQVPGLDAAQVKTDADSSAVTNEMAAIQQEAADRKIPGTPWFYVGIGNSKPYEIQLQSLTAEAFRPVLDDALKG